MKVVVTGATGFIGRRLVARLLDCGHEVTALSRDVERARRVLPVRCRIECWDGTAPPTELLSGADAVVHLAGAGVADQRWTPRRKREINDSRVIGSRAIVRAMADLPRALRPRTLVGASAIGYYGDRSGALLGEQDRPGEGFLADVCRAWEHELLMAEALAVRTAVIRVGIVLGASGGALQKMLAPFRLGLGGRLGSGTQWMSWIHLDDIVGLLAFSVENSRVRGPINGVAPRPVTNTRFTALLARALRRPAVFPVPRIMIRAAFGEMSALMLSSQRVAAREACRLGFTYRYPELTDALDDICSDLSRERTSEQWLPLPLEQVFPFFSDAHNLERITPEFLSFQVRGVNTDEMRDGTVIDYRLRLHGIPLRWRSVIEGWSPDRRFVDRQMRGPYAQWIHTHEFEPHAGGTVVRDKIRYALPLSPLSDLVASRIVERDLDQIFDFRRRKLAELFG